MFVKGDIAVRYGRVVEVLNTARDAGLERVGLLVDHETNPPLRTFLPGS
jgi:biopolymer transport protein ExbD